MQELDDIELLRRYAEQDSEEAFTTLVTRHVNLVYSTALRQVGRSHPAEEITQAVFVILAKKARSLRQGTVLSGWLYQAARLTAANFLRSETQRTRREQEAYMQSTLNETETEAWMQISPLLDSAMAGLSEKDRNAIVLRFFEGRNLRDVGGALGASEDAAKKRVTRALEKLRHFFTKRGITLSTVAIATAVSANSIQAAPIGLTVSAVAAAKGSAVTASTLTLIKGALKVMAWTKMKTTAVTGAIILLAAGTTTVVVKTIQGPSAPDIQGTWEASLSLPGAGVHAGESPKTRVVFKITKQNGEYHVMGDSIDQGIKDVPVSKLIYNHPSFHAEIEAFGYTYDGTLNRAATEISGQCKLNGVSQPLIFKRTSNPPSFPEPLADEEVARRAGSDLQGFWKGRIGNGKNSLSVVVKIAEPLDGTFRADFFVPEQGGGRQPATIVYDKPTVQLFIMAGFGMFEGELSNGGTELVGNWIQGGGKTPTILTRADSGAADLSGVGLVLRFDDPTQTVRIMNTVPNSSAAEAGLPTGFIVQKIDGVSVRGKSFVECVNLIRGTAGTKVRLELTSPDQKESKSVELTRRKLKL